MDVLLGGWRAVYSLWVGTVAAGGCNDDVLCIIFCCWDGGALYGCVDGARPYGDVYNPSCMSAPVVVAAVTAAC